MNPKQELITEIVNSVSSNQLSFGEQQYNPEQFQTSNFLKYLDSFSKKEIEVLKTIIKSKESNRITLVLETISYFYRFKKNNPKQLLNEIARIEKGYLPKFTYSDKTYKFCEETYFGFLRALRTNTLYTTKVEIHGKLKRVFIKSPIGKLSKQDIGYHRLMIDPETFRVYTFRTDDKGKIISESIKPPVVDLRNKGIADPRYLELEDFKKQFTKDMIYYLDKTYGIDTLVKSFSLFDGKTNLERLEFSKDIIFEYLEKKYGETRAPEIISKLVKSLLSQYKSKEDKQFTKDYLELVIKDHYTKTKGKDKAESLFRKTIFEKTIREKIKKSTAVRKAHTK